MFSTALASAQPKILNVCDALNSPVNRQEVYVRGTLWSATDASGFNEEGLNGEPCPGWRGRYFTWPSPLVFYLGSALGVQLTPAQEQANLEAWKRLNARYRRDFMLKVPSIVLKGVLVKQTIPLAFRKRDGSYTGWGVPPFGDYFAAFVITEIPNVP